MECLESTLRGTAIENLYSEMITPWVIFQKYLH